jgi:predicted nucleic acid-binding protein
VSVAFDRPPVVLDASVAIASALQQWPGTAAALERWAEEGRIRLVPATFWSETANGLLVGNRVDPNAVRGHLVDLSDLGLEVADRGLAGVLETIDLAERHRLTIYDALYLYLALDTDATLATYDGVLASAARAEGVELEKL